MPQGNQLAHGQRLTGATALWLYAGVLVLFGVYAMLEGLQSWGSPMPSNEGYSYVTGTLWMLIGVGCGFLGFIVLRTGVGLRYGNAGVHLRTWATAAAALLLLVGIIWIHDSVASSFSALESLRTPGIMMVIVALLLGVAAYLWRIGSTVAAATLGSLGAFMLLVTGRFKGAAALSLADVAIPIGLLATFGILLVAVAAVVATQAHLKGLSVALLCGGVMLLSFGALASMVDILGTDPFGAAGDADDALAATSHALRGIAGIVLGVAGAAALVSALLALVLHAPALKTLAGTPARACGRCATPMGTGRYCPSCGQRAAA